MNARPLLTCAAAALITLQAAAGIFPLRRAKEKKEPEPTRYEKIFKDKTVTRAEGGLMDLYIIDGKLYMQIPLELMGRRMLITSSPSSTSDNNAVMNGRVQRDPVHVRFTLEDSTVYLRQVNFAAPGGGDDRARRAVELSYAEPILYGYPVKAYTSDSAAVVIEPTKLFTDDVEALSPVSEGYLRFNVKARMSPKMSRLTGVKSFPGNVIISSSHQYLINVWYFLFIIMREQPVSVEAVRTITLLPEEGMTPRRSDRRVGVKLSEGGTIPEGGGPAEPCSWADRWRLEPADTAGYARGEISEPLRPIVMYLDGDMPPSWREPVREGILRWNAAFEKIGFRNAVQVRDFPDDDPLFDPCDSRYSCVRYVPSRNETAEGVVWADPRTGEILCGTMQLSNGLAMRLNLWRMVQTAQVDPRVRVKVMPEDVMYESLAYAASHEMGHILGLTHNMAASASCPVDSLRSPSFTARYGITSSIMDYARFNYVAQPGDEGVRLTPPDLGPYDYFAIKWLYGPDAGKWAEKEAADPVCRFVAEQTLEVYDPSALAEDLGDDPILAGEYGIANLKYIIERLPRWFDRDNDPDAEHRKLLMSEITKQYQRYVGNVISNVGGIYLDPEGDGRGGRKPVPAAVQSRSVRWAAEQLLDNGWLNNPELTGKLSVGMPPSPGVSAEILSALLASNRKVAFCSALSGDPYTVEDFYDDIYEGIWRNAIHNKPLTVADKLLQRQTLKAAKMPVARIGGGNYLHVPDHAGGERFPEPGYGLQPKLVTDVISAEGPCQLEMIKKIKSLMERRVLDAPLADDRLYYRSVLMTVTHVLEE